MEGAASDGSGQFGAAGRGELYAWLVPERVRAWR